jgi:hypothetical protein
MQQALFKNDLEQNVTPGCLEDLWSFKHAFKISELIVQLRAQQPNSSFSELCMPFFSFAS